MITISVYEMKRVGFIVIVVLLLSVVAMGDLVATHGPSGATRTTLRADSVEVIWYNVYTSQGQQHTVEYAAMDEPVDIYVVAQSYYNVTSKEIPSGYIHHERGSNGMIILQGPLSPLFYIVYSEVEQVFICETYLDSPYSFIRRTYNIQLVLLVLGIDVTILVLGYRFKERDL